MVSEQSLYNLTARTVELEVIPALRHYGVGLIPWSPLAGGLLGGIHKRTNEGRRADASMQKRVEDLRPQLEAYEALREALGEQPADVALAWLLHQPAVTATIVGPARPTSSLPLSAQSMSTCPTTRWSGLNEIWPGPGGEAPHAYAW